MRRMDSKAAKKFQCQRCERRFVRREHLSRHERSHTKEKPYHCMLCSQAFTRRDLLVRHNRLYHVSAVQNDPIPSPTSLSQSLSPPKDLDSIVSRIHNDNVSSRSEYTTSPTQTQPFDELSASYTVSNGAAQLALGTVDTESWNGGTEVENSELGNAGILLAPQLEESWLRGTQPEGDFASFLDSMALPRHQFSDFSYFEQPLPYFSNDSNFNTQAMVTPVMEEEKRTENTTSQDHDLTQFGSRLPSLQPEDHIIVADVTPRKTNVLTDITVQAREAVLVKLQEFSNVVPAGFNLVSRHALSRYIAGFIAGFHEHLPFLHIPTMSVETCALELTLALAAIGAQYCREPDKGLEIFRVAKAVCVERIRWRDQRKAAGSSTSLSSNTPDGFFEELPLGQSELGKPANFSDGKPIETAQALLVLMAMATWFKWRPPAREAPAIRSLLETLMRDEGLRTVSIPDDISWDNWIEYEGMKRTKFVVFCFFNLHSIVYDIPPMIMNSKIDMDLPCMESEWKAMDARSWREARRQRKPEWNFRNAFSSLFKDVESAERRRFSSLGSYILIHALIQHIWLTQELRRCQAMETERGTGHLRPADVTALEHALKSWQYSWEYNPESSVDPLSPHGPLSFNSTALLRLAYIRINIDTGSICSLGSGNPTMIATSICMSPPIQRCQRMTRAALHCAHALSIPIKLGINSIAHTRLFWSIQHALCSLECALLLTKWLESVTVSNPTPPLTDAESKLLGFVMEMVAETDHAAPPADLLEDNRKLSAIVVRVWAKLFRADDIWEMVNMIGRSLELYADMLES